MSRKFFYLLLVVAALLPVACKKNEVINDRQQFNPVATKMLTLPEGYEAGDVQFDQDGQKVATLVKQAAKMAMRINSQADAYYEEVREPQFAQGLTSWAYIAKDRGREFVVVNGKPGAGYDAVEKLKLTATGNVIYTAKKSDKWLLVSNGRESKPVDGFNDSPLIFAEGGRIAVAVKDAQSKKQYLLSCDESMNNCSNGNQYDAISELRTDKSGKRLVYTVSKGNQKAVVSLEVSSVAVEKIATWYDDVGAFDVSDNGQHLAYLARRGTGYLLVKDGAEMPVPKNDITFDVAVSNTGRVLYVVMNEGKVLAYLDGERIGGVYDELDGASFSENGANYAYTVKKGEKHNVVVNGIAGPPFDMVVTPRFVPAGNRVVYRARESGKRFVVVADEKGRTLREHPHYDAVWEVTVAPDGKSAGYGVKQGNDLWWKVEPLE